MEKRVWKSGDSIHPEAMNALMDLSYEKKENEIGHLPFPPNYYDKVAIVKVNARDSVINLTGINHDVVVVEINTNDTSSSTAPLEFNTENFTAARVVFVVPYGPARGINIHIPVGYGDNKTLVAIHPGNSAMITWYQSRYLSFTWYEFWREPIDIDTPTAHDFTLHTSEDDHVKVVYGNGVVEIVPSDLIKVKGGNVDFTVQFFIDYNTQNFGGPFTLLVYDESAKKYVLSKTFKDAGEEKVLMTCRFAFLAENTNKYSIRVSLSANGRSFDVSNVNVTGTWIEQ